MLNEETALASSRLNFRMVVQFIAIAWFVPATVSSSPATAPLHSILQLERVSLPSHLECEAYPKEPRPYSTAAFRIKSVREGSLMARYAAILSIHTEKLSVLEIDGATTRCCYPARQVEEASARLSALLRNKQARPLRLFLWDMASTRTAFGEGYDIQFETWDGGIELSGDVFPLDPILRLSNGDLVQTANPSCVVLVSPESILQAVRKSARDRDLDRARSLAALGQKLYLGPDLGSAVQGAISGAIEGIVAERLTNARDLEAKGQYGEAASVLRRTLAEYPESAENVASVAESHFRDGKAAAQSGNLATSVHEYVRALAVLPDYKDVQDKLAGVRRELVDEALARVAKMESVRDYQGAVGEITQAIPLAPEDQRLRDALSRIDAVQTERNRARLAEESERTAKAEAAQQAADLAQRANRCRAALNNKDYDAALDLVRGLLDQSPSDPTVRTLAARVAEEVPPRAYRSHEDAERFLVLPKSLANGSAQGSVGTRVDWHGVVRTKTVDNWYVVSASDGTVVVRSLPGRVELSVGQRVRIIGTVVGTERIGTLGGPPQSFRVLRPDRID